MYVTKHNTGSGPVWALDGRYLSTEFHFSTFLAQPQKQLAEYINAFVTDTPARDTLLPPIDDDQEVWAAGVTYFRSREAREAETEVKDIYDKVYGSERPELFFKALGFRVKGHGDAIRIRGDSRWNVPEPELTIVINSHGEIAGYCVGNDVSSRDIEGENPLYLPQAKIYEGSCALGPGIRFLDPSEIKDLPIEIEIIRNKRIVFKDSTASSQMNRSLRDLTGYLMRELSFPRGVFLMTGTGIVPPENFSMQTGDRVRININSLILENEVEC
jgi:2-dehydro-3-deoxy-D-arabinonate dehydratase